MKTEHPYMIAREWLKAHHERWFGDCKNWNQERKDKYHTELGLLLEFVEDCWPPTPPPLYDTQDNKNPPPT